MGSLLSKVKSVTGISTNDTNLVDNQEQILNDDSKTNGQSEPNDSPLSSSTSPPPSLPLAEATVDDGDLESASELKQQQKLSANSIDEEDTEEEDSQALFQISSTTNHLDQEEESRDSLIVNANSTIGCGDVSSVLNGSSNGHHHNEDSVNGSGRISDNDEDGKESSIAESEASDIMRTSTPTKKRGKRSKNVNSSKRVKVEDDRKYACNQPNCGWAFKTLYHLNRHRQKIHGISEPLTAAGYALMQQQQKQLEDPGMDQYLNQMMAEDQHSLSAF